MLFTVLVPAHDEEALIGRLLSSLHGMTYPLERVNEGVEQLTSKAGAPVRLVVLPQA